VLPSCTWYGATAEAFEQHVRAVHADAPTERKTLQTTPRPVATGMFDNAAFKRWAEAKFPETARVIRTLGLGELVAALRDASLDIEEDYAQHALEAHDA
jgi:hypothetical protein